MGYKMIIIVQICTVAQVFVSTSTETKLITRIIFSSSVFFYCHLALKKKLQSKTVKIIKKTKKK